MKFVYSIIILSLMIFFNMSANSSSFKGYKRQLAGEYLNYTETVDRVSETQQDFLILISHHAALYRFPKNVRNTDQVRDFFNTRMKSKNFLIFIVDPTKAEILSVSDVQK